jgi:hypothetical protein
MAGFGAKRPVFRVNGETNGIVIGKLVAANLTVTPASGELYADDVLAEEVTEFASGSIAMETDDLTADNAAALYGATLSDDGTLTYKAGDAAPLGELAYYQVLMRNKIKFYRGLYYPQARAALGNSNAQTKGNSITFQTTSTTFTIFAADDGSWHSTKEFGSEAEARAWVDAHCGIPSVVADLSSLTLGSLSLSPAFDSGTTSYTASTTNATNTVTATAADSGASVVITLNSTINVPNGSPAAWDEGANTLAVLVTNGAANKTYTVTVTKS